MTTCSRAAKPWYFSLKEGALKPWRYLVCDGQKMAVDGVGVVPVADKKEQGRDRQRDNDQTDQRGLHITGHGRTSDVCSGSGAGDDLHRAVYQGIRPAIRPALSESEPPDLNTP
jgi:hypothetical protein